MEWPGNEPTNDRRHVSKHIPALFQSFVSPHKTPALMNKQFPRIALWVALLYSALPDMTATPHPMICLRVCPAAEYTSETQYEGANKWPDS